MATLGDVKARVRGLIGDPMGDFATDEYLLPLVNQAYDNAKSYLGELGMKFETREVIVANIPASTNNTQAYQQPGQPLAGLLSPERLMVKAAGAPIPQYIPATQVDELPPQSNVLPNAIGSIAAMQWELRTGVLWLSSQSVAFDLLVYGDFTLSPLLQDGDVVGLHENMGFCLAYLTAALIGIERDKANWQTTFGNLGQTALDDIGRQLTMETQGGTYRIGRSNGRRYIGCRNF